MRLIAPFLIALFAIMGIAAAEVEYVEIISPQDGAELTVNQTILIRTMATSINGGQMFGRLLIDDEPMLSSRWVPTEPGVYKIAAEFADNRQFINSIKDEIKVIVI